MADSVFDKLVHGISSEEKKTLLQQIGEKAAVSEDPLALDDDDREAVDLEEVYNGLGIVARIILFIKMLFTGRNREYVLENDLLAGIAHDIQKRSSGIMDFGAKNFLPAFHDELKMLKDNVEPFSLPLQEAAGQKKGEFIAFLAGLYMEELQARILRETDPYYQIKKSVRKGDVSFTPDEWEDRENMDIPPSAELSDAEVKRMMEGALEDSLSAIPQDSKTVMYEDMKVFYHLVNLSRFSFDRLLSPFSSGPTGVPAPCPMGRLKEPVVKLAEIMCNLKSPPSPVLLRALFLFCSGDKTGSTLEGEVVRQLTTAGRALQNIREINKRMPWLLVARYVQRKVNYRCAISGGAEDWFALLKQFWRDMLDICYKDFGAKRKEKELRREIRIIFDPLPVRETENYHFPLDDTVAPGSFFLSMSLVKSFIQNLFVGEMNNYLKTVLIDGVFYKEDNRKEYTDGFNAVLKASGMLERFESRLAPPKGDVAVAVETCIKEYAPAVLKRRKMQGIIREADLDAGYLLQIVQGGLISLAKVVNGILYGEIGGKYDSLSNLPEIGGRANADFRRGLDETLRKLNAVNGLLQTLVSSEKSWQENRESKEAHA